MRELRSIVVLGALAALAACGGNESRGGITAEEDRELNEAAAMLDEPVFDASPDSLVANEAEIEAMEAESAAQPSGNGGAAENGAR